MIYNMGGGMHYMIHYVGGRDVLYDILYGGLAILYDILYGGRDVL